MRFNFAPIALFVYNRLDHTTKTLEALRRNTIAKESDLVIFSDFPKNSNAVEGVSQVREYIKMIDGFKSVSIVEQTENFGLAKSIIEGTTQILNQYENIIVLEDDLVTSKFFLEYMNKALDTYEKNPRIISISGFSFSNNYIQFPLDYAYDNYLHYRPMSWGWATWNNRWKGVDWTVSDYNSFKKSISAQKKFNKGGSDLTRMLRHQMDGTINSWYIRWAYHANKYDLLTIYPRISFVNNIGHDGSGVHCTNEKNIVLGHTELRDDNDFSFSDKLKIDSRVIKSFNKAFSINLQKVFKKIKFFLGYK